VYSNCLSSITKQRFVAWLDKWRVFNVIIDNQSEDTQIRTKNQHEQRFDVGVKN